jgi:peptide/nickel transport system ATP-binding protein
MSTLLAVKGLSVSYRRGGAAIRAVDVVDLTVPAGTMLGLVGESGCGKSTLARALMGVLPGNASIDGGSVLLCGEDLMGLTPERRRERLWRELSFVPQTSMNALDPVYRLRDQMREVLRERGGLSTRSADERAAALFRSVGLDPVRLMDFPHQFSGGMRQRAAIAMALALNPKLVIADEPVTALDVIVQRQVLDTIRGLGRDLGLSAIIVTHDISVVTYLCSLTAVMYAGRIVEQGSTEALTRRPAHPYTMGLMNASPDLHEPVETLVPIEGTPPDLADPPKGCRFAARCPFVLSACRETDPPPVSVAPGHSAACLRATEAGTLRDVARKASTWTR